MKIQLLNFKMAILLVAVLCLQKNVSAQWEQLPVIDPAYPTQNFYSIYFTDDYTGYAGGYEGIYRTADAGNSWTKVVSDASFPMLAFHFVNSNVGFAVGGKNHAYKTTNGGITWTNMNLPYRGVGLSEAHAVYFLDNNIGFIGAAYQVIDGTQPRHTYIYKTIDGGLTWTTKLDFTDAFIMDGPRFTTDRFSFRAFSFLNPSTAFAVGSSIGGAVGVAGLVYKTVDAGQTWTVVTTSIIDNLDDVRFVSPVEGYIYGRNCIYKTTDGGSTWISNGCTNLNRQTKAVNISEAGIVSSLITFF